MMSLEFRVQRRIQRAGTCPPRCPSVFHIYEYRATLTLTLAAQCLHLSPPVSHPHSTNLAPFTISELRFLTLATSVVFVATLGLALSLPTLEQLETGEFNLGDLVTKFTKTLVEDSQRNEILQLTGDTAVLVIECLDKVGEIGSRS